MNLNAGTIQPYVIQPKDTLWKIAQDHNTTVYAIAILNPNLDLHHLSVGQTIYVWPGLGHNMATLVPDEKVLQAKSELDLNNAMRHLWETNVNWVRMVIMSMVYQMPDVGVASNRLLRFPAELEQIFKKYYTPGNVTKLGQLFREHILLGMQYVNNKMAGDEDALKAVTREWYANADQIAAFLASINPHWSMDEWKKLLHQYLKMGEEQVEAFLAGHYVNEIEAFDHMVAHALKMADAMTWGIVKQYEDWFF